MSSLSLSSGTGRTPSLWLVLPSWVDQRVRPGTTFTHPIERMRLVIDLARENVARKTGGPFGAGVFERDSGRLIAAGVNVVESSRCSLAHAEAMALALAQQVVGTHDLANPGLPPLELVASAQPCCQCLGMVWWSGVVGLSIGARREDVESITGFSEGPLPDHWVEAFEGRTGSPPIAVSRDLLREQALDPLRAYHTAGWSVYNPGRAAPV